MSSTPRFRPGSLAPYAASPRHRAFLHTGFWGPGTGEAGAGRREEEGGCVAGGLPGKLLLCSLPPAPPAPFCAKAPGPLSVFPPTRCGVTSPGQVQRVRPGSQGGPHPRRARSRSAGAGLRSLAQGPRRGPARLGPLGRGCPPGPPGRAPQRGMEHLPETGYLLLQLNLAPNSSPPRCG